jgi:hypothetical protein
MEVSKVKYCNFKAVTWLRQLVTGLLLWRPRSGHVGFVVDKVALGQVLWFSAVNIIPPGTVIVQFNELCFISVY